MLRSVLKVVIESPLYFTYRLPDRLLLLRRVVERIEVQSQLRENLEEWVRTGYFKRR